MVVKSLIKPFFISLSIPVKISVKLSRKKEIKEVNLEKGSTVLDLLKQLKLKPDTIIVMNNNLPIPVDDVLEDNQNLSIIQVSSGG
jgi:sulfur carrier protein ThiS